LEDYRIKMVVRKHKKVIKYRSHTTHGGGHRKKRRGAGSRGGRGNAGTGKRAGHKKAGQHRIFGRHGFRPRRTLTTVNPINISYFTPNHLEKLVAKGQAVKEGDLYVIDLTKLGYTKLLGAGSTKAELKLTIEQSSERAVAKISAAGGSVVTSSKKAEAKEQVQQADSETPKESPHPAKEVAQ
jgi:large subunit ribosomal protein L15